MMKTNKAKKSGSKYQTKAFEEKFKALKDVGSGIKKSAVAHNLGIPLSTLSTWLKNHDKIEAAVLEDGLNEVRKRRRNSQFEDVEEALLNWFQDARKNNLPINGPLLTKKAEQLAEKLEVDDFKCSVGWLNHFKARYGILFRKISGKETVVNDVALSTWEETVLRDIFQSFNPMTSTMYNYILMQYMQLHINDILLIQMYG